MARKNTDPKHVDISLSQGIKIVWTDGHESNYALDYLRKNCPCATCRNIHGTSDQPADKPANAPIPFPMFKAATKLTGAESVGRYAVQLLWNDGPQHGHLFLRPPARNLSLPPVPIRAATVRERSNLQTTQISQKKEQAARSADGWSAPLSVAALKQGENQRRHAAGKRSSNVVPLPGWLRNEMEPPLASASERQRARPRPVPVVFVVTKAWKMSPVRLGSMPQPVSVISSTSNCCWPAPERGKWRWIWLLSPQNAWLYLRSESLSITCPHLPCSPGRL